MKYKGINVFLDSRIDTMDRLDFAIGLAKTHDAHLTVTYISHVPFVYFDQYGQWGPMMNQWELESKKKHEISRAEASAMAKKEGISFSWNGYQSTQLAQIIASARAHDLTVIAQKSHTDKESDFGSQFYEAMLLKLGRPILILPFQRFIPKKFERIVLAWDSSREVTRASWDAMPLLQLARQIRVIVVPETAKDDAIEVDIQMYLSRHGIQTEMEKYIDGGKNPAEILLSRSAELDAELLVMGAYGHHRLTEFMFGGTTRDILKGMNLPVLMSH